MSGKYHGCSDIPGLCSNDVCSESKLQSDRFRAQTVHLWQLFSETTLYTVRLQLYKSCTMMFTLVSIINPRITMVGQYSEIREHLQTFNVDYLGTSKMTGHIMVLLYTRYVNKVKYVILQAFAAM